MAAWVLFLSSLTALVLLVFHSWRRRGGRVTAAFFIPGILFGVLRGNVVHYIMVLLSDTGAATRPYLPQNPILPDIGHASIQVVIGWVFAGYLAWTLAEYVLRRVQLQKRLFPTVAFAALFMSAMSYCMETTATRVGWWYWEMSTVDRIFGHAPSAGILAWFSIATDLIFPVLFITCSAYRRRPWRWVALLVFPLHMVAHALYATVPFIDHVHDVMILALAALALFNRTRIETGFAEKPAETGRSVCSRLVDLIPAIAVGTFFIIMLRADLLVVGEFTLAFTAIPLFIFALLAVRRVPVVVAVIMSAAGLAAGRWVGFRALYAFAPVVLLWAFYSADRSRRGRLVALGWLLAVAALIGVQVTQGETRRFRLVRFVRLLKQAARAETRGYDEVARELRAQAFRMEFTDPVYLDRSIDYMFRVYAKNPEAVLPEVHKRLQRILQMDPRWALCRTNWIPLLVHEDRLEEAIAQARAVVGIQPTRAQHHSILGYLLLRRGDTAQAEKELDTALDLGAEDPETRVNLALVASVTGSVQKAVDLLNQVLAEDPEHPIARLNLEHLRSDPKRVKADLVHLSAPGIFVQLGRLIDSQAGARAKAGDWSGAAQMMAKAVHYAPRDAGIRSNYGTALFQGGGAVEEAVTQFEMAVQMDEGFLPARRKLVGLYVRLARRQIGENRKEAARKTLRRALPYADGKTLAEIQRMLAPLEDTRP